MDKIDKLKRFGGIKSPLCLPSPIVVDSNQNQLFNFNQDAYENSDLKSPSLKSPFYVIHCRPSRYSKYDGEVFDDLTNPCIHSNPFANCLIGVDDVRHELRKARSIIGQTEKQYHKSVTDGNSSTQIRHITESLSWWQLEEDLQATRLLSVTLAGLPLFADFPLPGHLLGPGEEVRAMEAGRTLLLARLPTVDEVHVLLQITANQGALDYERQQILDDVLSPVSVSHLDKLRVRWRSYSNLLSSLKRKPSKKSDTEIVAQRQTFLELRCCGIESHIDILEKRLSLIADYSSQSFHPDQWPLLGLSQSPSAKSAQSYSPEQNHRMSPSQFSASDYSRPYSASPPVYDMGSVPSVSDTESGDYSPPQFNRGVSRVTMKDMTAPPISMAGPPVIEPVFQQYTPVVNTWNPNIYDAAQIQMLGHQQPALNSTMYSDSQREAIAALLLLSASATRRDGREQGVRVDQQIPAPPRPDLANLLNMLSLNDQNKHISVQQSPPPVPEIASGLLKPMPGADFVLQNNINLSSLLAQNQAISSDLLPAMPVVVHHPLEQRQLPLQQGMFHDPNSLSSRIALMGRLRENHVLNHGGMESVPVPRKHMHSNNNNNNNYNNNQPSQLKAYPMASTQAAQLINAASKSMDPTVAMASSLTPHPEVVQRLVNTKASPQSRDAMLHGIASILKTQQLMNLVQYLKCSPGVPVPKSN